MHYSLDYHYDKPRRFIIFLYLNFSSRGKTSIITANSDHWSMVSRKARIPILFVIYEPPHILQGRDLKDKKFPRFSTYFQRLLKDLLEAISYWKIFSCILFLTLWQSYCNPSILLFSESYLIKLLTKEFKDFLAFSYNSLQTFKKTYIQF
jgi:hypothetical protein